MEKDITSISVAKSHSYQRSDSCSDSPTCDKKAMIKFIVFVLYFLPGHSFLIYPDAGKEGKQLSF